MTSKELQERLTKAQDKLTKKEALLKKYEAKAEKIAKQIIARGWTIEGGCYQKHVNGAMTTDEAHDCYWTFCDYRDALDSIKSTKKAIEEQKKIVKKWADAEEKAKAEEKVRDAEYPEIFKEYEKNLIEAWTQQDLRMREIYRAEYKALGYSEFVRTYKYSAYEMMTSTEAELRKANAKAAKALILNLWNRVKDKVGTPTEYNLHVANGNIYEGIAINGFVKGTDGTATVDSIIAGGYNIQRLHIRVLVK